MIDSRIEILADDYAAGWNSRTIKEPLLGLDYSWQSVSTLELLSAEVLGNLSKRASVGGLSLEALDYPTRLVIRGVASYLAVMAHKCWSTFSVDVAVFYDARGSICISGQLPNGQVISVAIEEKLFEAYTGTRELPDALKQYEVMLTSFASNPLVRHRAVYNIYNAIKRAFFQKTERYRKVKELVPIMESFHRVAQPFDRRLPTFALGLFYGFSQYGNDACKSRKLAENQVAVEAVTKVLALTCVSYVQRCFPDEQIAQVAELYLHGLIYPPILMQEEFPLKQAVLGVVKFIKEYGVSHDTTLQLCQCLMQNPDYIISATGMTIYVAVAEQATRQALISACSMGENFSLFRPAMLLARRELMHRDDWLTTGLKNATDVCHLKVERELGFIPWICLPEDFLIKNAGTTGAGGLGQAIVALASLKYAEAECLLDKSVLASLGDVDIKLQLAFLKTIVGGSFKETSKVCREMVESSDVASKNYAVYKLWGYAETLAGEIVSASRHFVIALEYCPQESEEYTNIAHLLFVANAKQGLVDEAEKYSVLSLNHTKSFVKHGVFRYYWLIGSGRQAEANELLDKLFLFAPLEQSVLGLKILGL